MPMPKPTSTENHDNFIDRFMSDPVMLDEYPAESQRLAVAEQQWEDNKADDDEITDFPNVGDNKKISLKNSKFNQFDYNYAKDIRENHRSIWSAGGNEFGNQAFVNWGRVRNRKSDEYTKSDKEWIVRRERFMERHKKNKNLAGIVAVMKWGGIVTRGIKYMKDLMNEEKGGKMKKKTKNFMPLQIPQILDEEKRIIRLKASDGGYDRDDDRLAVEHWRMPEYNIPLVDSHKTGDSVDRRLGEIVNAFAKDGFWWNDVKLDIPEGNTDEWTDGEKIANRLWKLAKAGADIRVSVGFIPDESGMSRNQRGGIDYKGQEQTELSIVLYPSNSRAGNKQAGDILDMTKSLNYLLGETIKDMYPDDMQCSVVDIFPSKFVFNVWGNNAKGNFQDKYYVTGYVIEGEEVEAVGQITEIEPMRAFKEKSKLIAEIKVDSKELADSIFQKLKEHIKIETKIPETTNETKVYKKQVESILNNVLKTKFK